MLEVIAIIAVVLAIAIAVVLILAATKPDSFSVTRAIDITAPAERIFPLINDFHQWGAWSPWENKDPVMKRSYDGQASGKGAVYGWDGNKNVGSGRMEILEASAPSKILIKLDFLHRRVHHAAARRGYPSDLGNARSGALHVKADAGVHESGPDDRQGF